ncbi:ShlB/FhaC/HecB family hemolysin secretion/activation protein [Pseudomonas aeruginosa]|uniref:ShlB/FhaC/HecB family hemolysin secretion/activation protein n=1 Tax=Pseudomonas aeruginosa TaxID=287 RepID=UPI00233EA186|nr:ShlB/FhaC/HecB family hemolysin secretion/activation protein [Pseudomonas aeruginosa]WCI76583.1 ShlB/FhaC/HecB family hemolysin secretion/activation protein [Pseudomonas aeruginosa]
MKSWLSIAWPLSSCACRSWPAPPLHLPGDRDLIRDRQQRLLDEQRKRLEELQQLPGKGAPAAADASGDDERCFEIRRIELEGAGHLGESARRQLLAPYQGRCLGVGQLNALLKAVTDHYLDRGYVTTRAYLPQQDLASGTLRIIVVEGRLEGLDSSALASPRELAMSFPGRTGELLDLRELEQLVDQLSRLPSRQAQLELVPGSEVGGSRVRLKGERDKPWRVSATRNNDGDVSTGEQQMGLSLDWDSPLGLDQLNLRANRHAVTDRLAPFRQQQMGLFYHPCAWGPTAGAIPARACSTPCPGAGGPSPTAQSDYRTRNEASGFPFKLDGDSRSHQFRAERVLHRDGVSKTAMSLGLSHQRTNNYVEDTRLEDQSTRITETQLGFNHGRRIGSGFVNLDLGWQQGIGALGAQGRGHPQAGDPNARYDKYSLTLSYLQPFQLWGERFSFDSLATGQRSEDVLFSPQRISLGGNSSVRGFKDQTLTGDSGGYWRNQLRWRRAVEWAPLRPWLQEYGVAFAYDVGVIRHDRYNDGASGRMSGNAIELDARGRYFAASVGFARSLERPSAIERREHPIYFRVDAFF